MDPDKLQSVLMDIVERLKGVETLLGTIKDANQTAILAEQAAKTAHQRIDDLKILIDKQDANITWMWRTIIGSMVTGFVGGASAVIWTLLKH